MRFEVLGPLRVVVGEAEEPVSIGPARQRVLLAALLYNAGRPVTADELADLIWDGAPPAGAVGTTRAYVMRLRRALGERAGAKILTRDPGYLVELDESELDALRFEALCRDAGEAVRGGRWAEASAAAARALGLWRGAALADVGSQTLRDQWVPHLEQLRLQAVEWRVDADLRLGRHDQLVPELWDLTERHPLRERLHAQLMVALARCGRQAEALAAYQRARRTLLDTLGVEPGPELRRIQDRVLAGDIALPAAGAVRPAPSRAVPRQLPAAIRHFAGRASELKVLSGLLSQAVEAGGAVVISAIEGTAGIGKTALAVYWAQQHADRFPDGQLYVNLRGFDPSGAPAEAATVVRGFLDALAVPAARIPAGLDAQLALYRSRLADKRALIVLDNARDSEQVRPLLPGSAGCLVLVTSRHQLTGLVALDGAVPVTLGLLTADEAKELLARRLGAERVTVEEEAVDELIELCARLPLALNIAAAQAAVRATSPLAEFVEGLRDARQRLRTLTVGESAADVRAVFSWSYQTLNPDAARLFRLLGVHPGPDISVPAAASLAAVDQRAARRLLRDLTGTHLLTEHAPGRYTFHDLLRAYAAEQAREIDSEEERRETLRRALDHYLHSAARANALIYPGMPAIELTELAPGTAPEEFADPDAAVAWLERERPVLVAGVTAAAEHGFTAHAWRIPWAIVTFMNRAGYWRDWVAISEAALAAAIETGDTSAQAQAHRWLGNAMAIQGSLAEADEHQQQALTLFEQLGDDARMCTTHLAMALTSEWRGDLQTSLAHTRRALELADATGSPTSQAQARSGVGWYSTLLGRHEESLAHCERALALFTELGDRSAGSSVLDTMGRAHLHLGHHAEAIDYYRRALEWRRAGGDLFYQAQTLSHLGEAYLATGDTGAARDAWRDAIAIFGELGSPDAESVRDRLRELEDGRG